MINLKYLLIALYISTTYPSDNSSAHGQLALSNLTKIGVISGTSYNLKLTGSSTVQLIVVKLLPNLTNLSSCGSSQVDEYKKMLVRILQPINSSLARIKSAIKEKPINKRNQNPAETPSPENFWGAVIGGIALGIATSAQITAGIALHNSLENARQIEGIKDAIQATHNSISSLQTAQAKTVVAINALQEQINNQLYPAIHTLGCDTVANTLGLKLNQYFSELSLIFGPNLRDPSSETISIQAISKAFNGDFDSLMKVLGYSSYDFLDMMESNAIRGRIIDVSLDYFYIALQIEYPTLITLPNTIVYMFNLISYHKDGDEWLTNFPPSLLVRGDLVSGIYTDSCTFTSNSLICASDTSYPLSNQLYLCARGDTSKCSRSRVVNSLVPRFALYQGVIFANCFNSICRCIDPTFPINQDPSVTNIMVASNFCREILIGGIYIRVGPRTLQREVFSHDVEVGEIISITPIDISTELSSVTESLNDSVRWLERSKEILARLNSRILSKGTMITIIVCIALIGIIMLITVVWLIYLTRKVVNNTRVDERSPLISHAPSVLTVTSDYGTNIPISRSYP